ncbi:unnamed protein product [Medioppia subpectinata]|uniref:DNA 5'-3' helicase n=1 Tax=Medioppia subpectinata TaxID=1979941 RepID=A0A7R9L3L9_9ACAR|nr:unnamed protein product [Medioppia subpectinata]CAG2114633.1 unnamed protein product [Medioppia subpectinata]
MRSLNTSKDGRNGVNKSGKTCETPVITKFSDTLRNVTKTVTKYPAKSCHSAITTFQTLREEILNEMKDPLYAGVQWKRFPELNDHLKGHRSGELSIFTGPTGSGKTTFMSEYSLDLCSQGVSTLWGSFEVKNVRLAKMMITQMAGKCVAKNLHEFDVWADRMETLPLYFMTFHGQESIDKVLSAMSYSVEAYGVRHVIIDNIQFMLGMSPNQKFDRYWQQDLVIDQFRKFATRNDCHITLVMHPRKEEDMNELNNNSIFGGAKATQEADNVLILQNKWLSIYKCNKYIQITKNRFDGDIGKVPLWFDKDSLSYSPISRRLTHSDTNSQVNQELNEFKSLENMSGNHVLSADERQLDLETIRRQIDESDDIRLQ